MSAGYSERSAAVDSRTSLAALPFILLIHLYRITLSPLLASLFGVGCRFEPTCSAYAISALHRYGAWRGSMLAIKRLLRCHPWHEGGFDPVE